LRGNDAIIVFGNHRDAGHLAQIHDGIAVSEGIPDLGQQAEHKEGHETPDMLRHTDSFLANEGENRAPKKDTLFADGIL
jgi:hypothetical protein